MNSPTDVLILGKSSDNARTRSALDTRVSCSLMIDPRLYRSARSMASDIDNGSVLPVGAACGGTLPNRFGETVGVRLSCAKVNWPRESRAMRQANRTFIEPQFLSISGRR